MARPLKRQPWRWPQRLRKNPQFVLVLALLMLCGWAIFMALIPGQVQFETRLVASQLSFTTHDIQKPFLRGVPVTALSLEGQQDQPLTLVGEFLNEPFQDLTALTLELPYADSRLVIRPQLGAEGASPAMLLTELQLQPSTQVSDLSYNLNTNQLALTFTQPQDLPPTAPALLRLNLAPQPFEVDLEGYRLPDLGLEEASMTQPRRVVFIPPGNEWQPPLPLEGKLALTLPVALEADGADWFWGDLGVKDVNFVAWRSTGRRVEEEVALSTIRSGQLRMLDQELTLEADQFLIVQKPGIQRLRALKLLPAAGIEVRAVGHTSEVEVGLDPNFPIQGIGANFWEQRLPPHRVVALLSFAGAMLASLLAWLVDNLFKDS